MNISAQTDTLFQSIFTSQAAKNFDVTVVNQRADYYAGVQDFAKDQDGLFYIVGSDEFLEQNIAILREAGIPVEQIIIDKHQMKRDLFLAKDE